MKNNFFRLLFVYLACFIFLSCASIQRKKPPVKATPAAQEQLLAAKKLIKQGKIERGLKQLKQIAKSNSDTDIADDASILAGKTYYRLKDYQNAASSYMLVVDSKVYSPLESKALMAATDSYLKLGRYDEALALTKRGLKYRQLPKKEKLKLHQLRFEVLSQLGDRLDAFEALVYLSENDPDKNNVDAYRVKAQNYLESTLNDDELQQIAKRRKFGKFRSFAFYRLGKAAFEQRNFELSKDYLEEVIDIAPESDLAESANELIKQITARRRVNPKTIGAILPLSGRHAKVAEKTLQGMQLGLGIYGKNKSDFKLAIIDSEGNPDAARRAVERLVTEDHVVAVVGSLLSRTAIAVASKANELGVPTIALSQKSGITDVGDYVYRNALTSEMQIRELVRTAMEDRGMKRFAILYPNDQYGVEYANLFWDHVLARGGTISGAQSYGPKETDFGGAISRLVGKFYLQDRVNEYKLAVKEWLKEQKVLSSRISPPDDIIPPIVDFEAIFIPDSTKTVGQIAPMMAYYEIQDVTLLGTNLWNSKSLVKRGQRFVEGALFVDSMLVGDKSFKDSGFFRNYKKVFNEQPGVFASQGYDAALLLRQIIASGVSSRVEVKDQLLQIKNFPGSLGRLAVNDRRELTRPLIKLGVTEGRIVKDPKPPKKDEESPKAK